MAKIKFKDYLKKKKQQAIYESDEALLQRAKRRLQVDPMVVSPSYRVQNLESAAGFLKEVHDLPGAGRIYEDTQKLLKEAKAAEKEADYQRACLHLSEAKEEYEFGKAADEFDRLQGYKDSDEKKALAGKRAKTLNRRFQIRRIIVLAVIIALAWLVWYGYKNEYLNYAAGRLEGLGGKYQSAYGRLSKIYVLDSQKQADKYHTLYLRQREAAENEELPDANKGDTVSFAGEEWLVLKRRKGTLMLICQSPDKDGTFRNVAFNNGVGETAWADSTLRFYLNNSALAEFTDLEKSALVDMNYTPSGNEKYGISPSAEVLTDKVRIFDLDDLEKYGEVFETPGVDMWLASPGHDSRSAAYMTKSGTVMYYGNDVTDSSLSACPVITVDLGALGTD